MNRLLFYLRYAYRNLSRNRRWTIFGIFCIAAGVATVVALRSLGLAIGDSLIDNTRASIHGDILMNRGGSGPFTFSFLTPGDEQEVYADWEVDAVRNWVEQHGGQMSAYLNYGNMQVTQVDAVTVGRPQFVSAFMVDPQTFPPTGDVYSIDPPNVALRDLLTSENDIVVSKNLADTQNIKVGNTVRVSGTEELFNVRGIVPTETEANVRNLFASFFGFAYLNISNAEKLQFPASPNTISITLPPGMDAEAAETDLRNTTNARGQYRNVVELLRINSVIGDYIGRFIVIMGLSALLIGGVGIINTMLVMVGRRTSEIAALKTFGLKGRQVAALFLAEAFLLGLAGSIAGTVIGLLMSGIVNKFGEAFLLQRLTWRLYPEAVLYGLGLGLVVTMVFGIMPVLTAVRVRPAIILRPNEPHIAAVGCFQSLLGILLVILVIGGIAGQILGVFWVGVAGVAATLLVLALLIGVMWVIVWIVGHLPSFGWVDLRLALRNLNARRIRTSTTLLALSAGMFALSSITFIGAGTREILQFQLTQALGGNILIFPYLAVLSPEIAQTTLRNQLRSVPGIDYSTALEFYNLRLAAIDGEPPQPLLPAGLDADQLPPRVRRELNDVAIMTNIQNTTNPSPNLQIVAGRAITADDRGQHVIVLSQKIQVTQPIGVGTTLTLRVNGAAMDFKVIGIMSGGASPFVSGASLVPPDSLGNTQPDFTLNIAQADDEQINRVLLDLSALVPPVLALDLRFIDGLLSRLIQQFSAIPLLVGLLSLLAAAVIMANTVSLATLERRRQIGILKAIGLKGRRVLLVMLLENTLIGLLGGVLGIGLSALGVSILTALGMGDTVPIPREATTTAIALIVAAVLIAWIATFASARVAIAERVTNVLRYE